MKLSSTRASASPTTPGNSRTQASISAIAAGSPPDRTKSPRLISSISRASSTRSSTPSKRPQIKPHAGAGRQLAHPRLVERPAARRQMDQRPDAAGAGDRRVEHVGAHHHARPAAERRVVDRAVLVVARNCGCRPFRAATGHRANALPASECASGPGSISGKIVSTVARQVMRGSRDFFVARRVEQAGGRVDHDTPAGEIDDRHRGAGERHQDRLALSRAISSMSPAPKSCTAITVPSRVPSSSTAARPIRSAW